MTIWDDIYQNYQNGGVAWASLSDGIHPLFKPFLDRTDFPVKHVLDIGCGTGKYLKLLQAGGFRTDGIDSSQTAVQMTRDLLEDGSQILCVDMFEYPIPPDTYDLIISIATIHHGRKDEVKDLLGRIHAALVAGGSVFITLPDIASHRKWDTFKEHTTIAEGTYAPLSGPEQGLAHSFFSEAEVRQLFTRYQDVQLEMDPKGRWIIQASKYQREQA